MDCPNCRSIMLAVTHQPAPILVEGLPAIWDLVIQDLSNTAYPGSTTALVVEDMRMRDHVKAQDHGQRLQGFNGRDALIDGYQELLDAVVYIRQKVFEDGERSNARVVYADALRLVSNVRQLIKNRDGK